MIRFILSIFGAIFTWLTTGALVALLGIVGIFWMYGRDLPDHEDLSSYEPETISRIYSGEGRMIDEFARERRLFVPIGEIPERVKRAFISAEDKNFYDHQGFDARGIAAAVVEAVRSRGETLRGASTITQQVMKNFLLSGDRRVERKIKELILATRLEESLSKDKILELYLNEIFLGQNSYGVAAAAQTYFNKTLADLTIEEAAYLAALPRAPSNYHPVRDRERAVNRRNYVLREMFENGYITEAAYVRAREAPLKTVQGGDFAPFSESVPPRDYFTDEIRRQLTDEFGSNAFYTGGLSIRATIDPAMQAEAAAALRNKLEGYDRGRGVWRGTGETLPPEALETEEKWRSALSEVDIARDIEGWYPAVVLEVGETHARIGIEGVANDDDGHWIPPEDVRWARPRRADGSLGAKARVAGDLLAVGDVVHVRKMTSAEGDFVRWTLRQVPELEGAFVAMDVNTGRVLAMQGGFSYQHSVFNRATQATRQPGSAFKPFVYAAALDSGYTPATIVVDAPIEVDTGDGVWRPDNASHKFFGPAPLRMGIVRSRNVMTVRLARAIGIETVAGYAERFGVYEDMKPYLANALGSQETTLYDIVSAYAMFANGGERVRPTLVDRVQDRWGETVYRHDEGVCVDCEQADLPRGEAPTVRRSRPRVIDGITAYQITSMMQGVVRRGTAAGRVDLPVPVAGKTGTTNNSRDTWFVGFTSNIVAGCYIGYDQPRSMGSGAYGSTMCAPVFNEFMQAATEKFGGGPFDVPPGGHFVNIDRYSGARLSSGASGPNVVAEYFRAGSRPGLGESRMVDGGFAMGENFPRFARGETPQRGTSEVTTSTGETTEIPQKASMGTISSGGLY